MKVCISDVRASTEIWDHLNKDVYALSYSKWQGDSFYVYGYCRSGGRLTVHRDGHVRSGYCTSKISLVYNGTKKTIVITTAGGDHTHAVGRNAYNQTIAEVLGTEYLDKIYEITRINLICNPTTVITLLREEVARDNPLLDGDLLREKISACGDQIASFARRCLQQHRPITLAEIDKMVHEDETRVMQRNLSVHEPLLIGYDVLTNNGAEVIRRVA